MDQLRWHGCKLGNILELIVGIIINFAVDLDIPILRFDYFQHQCVQAAGQALGGTTIAKPASPKEKL
jgi:hypothetical protein